MSHKFNFFKGPLYPYESPKDLNIQVVPGDKATPPDHYDIAFPLGYIEATYNIADLVIWINAHPGEEFNHPFSYYFCPSCNGWIEGNPSHREINNLDSSHLAGRKGYAINCRRCGIEIGFFGIVS